MFQRGTFFAVLIFLGQGHATEAPRCEEVGAEGIQFENTPLEVNVPCNRTVLRGTSRNSNRAFLMPQPTVSVNRNGEQAFDLRERPDGMWVLNMGFFFPRTMESEFLNANLNEYYTSRCRIEEVRTYLNDPRRGYRTQNDPSIELAHLPVKEIRIKIMGVRGHYNAATLFHDLDTPISRRSCSNINTLDYAGKHFIAEFILSKEQKDNFLQRVSRLGVQYAVHVTFNARVAQGAVHGRFNLEAIAASLEAAFAGKVNITQAELRARLADMSTNLALNLVTEGDFSKNEQMQNLMQRITEQLFDAAKAAVQAAGVPPAQGNAAVPSGEINLRAVLEGLRQRQTLSMRYETLGRNQDLVYATTDLFKDENLTARSRKVQVTNLRGPVRVTNDFKRGQQISFSLVSQANQTVQIREVRNALSLEQIRADNVAEYFPLLRQNLLNPNPNLLQAGINQLFHATTLVLKEQSCVAFRMGCSQTHQTAWFEVNRQPSFEPQWQNIMASHSMANLNLAISLNLESWFTIESLLRASARNDLAELGITIQKNDTLRRITLTAMQDVGALHVKVARGSHNGILNESNSLSFIPKSFQQQKFDVRPNLSQLSYQSSELRPIDVPVTDRMFAPTTLIGYELTISGQQMNQDLMTRLPERDSSWVPFNPANN